MDESQIALLRRALIWAIAAVVLIGAVAVLLFFFVGRRSASTDSPQRFGQDDTTVQTPEDKDVALERLAGSSTPAELTPAQQWEAAQQKSAKLDRLTATSSSESQVSAEDKFKVLDSLKNQ